MDLLLHCLAPIATPRLMLTPLIVNPAPLPPQSAHGTSQKTATFPRRSIATTSSAADTRVNSLASLSTTSLSASSLPLPISPLALLASEPSAPATHDPSNPLHVWMLAFLEANPNRIPRITSVNTPSTTRDVTPGSRCIWVIETTGGSTPSEPIGIVELRPPTDPPQPSPTASPYPSPSLTLIDDVADSDDDDADLSDAPYPPSSPSSPPPFPASAAAPHLTVVLDPHHLNNGFSKESLKAVLAHVFRGPAAPRRVVSTVSRWGAEVEAAERVLEGLGFARGREGAQGWTGWEIERDEFVDFPPRPAGRARDPRESPTPRNASGAKPLTLIPRNHRIQYTTAARIKIE
ncbi:hypothetical protein HDU96_008924 [Phlyctochytrium bullatum]|nr:hypothetical protein HDU96_008924 [Phlyctochytrium bullatum]